MLILCCIEDWFKPGNELGSAISEWLFLSSLLRTFIRIYKNKYNWIIFYCLLSELGTSFLLLYKFSFWHFPMCCRSYNPYYNNPGAFFFEWISCIPSFIYIHSFHHKGTWQKSLSYKSLHEYYIATPATVTLVKFKSSPKSTHSFLLPSWPDFVISLLWWL